MCNDEEILKVYVENYYDGTGGVEFSHAYDISEEFAYSCDEDVIRETAIKKIKEACHKAGCPGLIEEMVEDVDDYLVMKTISYSAYHDGDRIIPCYSNGLLNAYDQINYRIDQAPEENREILQEWLDNVEEHWVTAWFVEEDFIRIEIKNYLKASA